MKATIVASLRASASIGVAVDRRNPPPSNRLKKTRRAASIHMPRKAPSHKALTRAAEESCHGREEHSEKPSARDAPRADLSLDLAIPSEDGRRKNLAIIPNIREPRWSPRVALLAKPDGSRLLHRVRQDLELQIR